MRLGTGSMPSPYEHDLKGLFMPVAAEPSLTDRKEGDRRTIASSELFGGQTEVLILHNGEEYRLRVTRQDKLILTK